MFLIYSPDGSNIYDPSRWEFKGIRSTYGVGKF